LAFRPEDAGITDRLALGDGSAPADDKMVGTGIGGDIAIGVFQQQQVAIAFNSLPA